jgi:site-specific DNA-methyltransferase (adenine-specific)
LRLSNVKNYRYDWVWNKVCGSNFMNLKKMPFKICENIMVFSSLSNFTFNPQRIWRTEKSLNRDPIGSSRQRKLTNTEVEHYSMMRTGVLELEADGKKHPVNLIEFCVFEKGRYEFRHPTKKPTALMQYLVETYTNEGDTVLDFTMGSGTTGVACKNLNRRFIGIELDEKYFEIAKTRIMGNKGQASPLPDVPIIKSTGHVQLDMFD